MLKMNGKSAENINNSNNNVNNNHQDSGSKKVVKIEDPKKPLRTHRILMDESSEHIFRRVRFRNFEDLRKEQVCLDLVVKVGKTEFQCHKCILALIMPYFRTIFSKFNTVPARQTLVEIKEADATSMELLINYAYSGKLVINMRNVESILKASTFLKIRDIKDTCVDFMMKRLSSENILRFKSLGKSYDCPNLFSAANEIVCRQFENISETEDFHLLTFSEVQDVISRNELFVEDEEKVFEAVIGWVRHDDIERKKFLPQLLHSVRLPLINKDYLTEVVAKEPLIRQSSRCLDMVHKAKRYDLIPKHLRFLNSCPRQYSK